MSEGPLAGLTVLVTRPRGRGGDLMTAIEAAGGQPLQFPAFDLVPRSPAREELAPLRSFGADDWLVFVSPAAVTHGWPLLAGTAPRASADAGLAAVGTATADDLASHSGRHVTTPRSGAGAGALLEMPPFRDLAGRRVALFEGTGGRAALPETLAARGARVVRVPVYERRRPADGTVLDALVREHGVDCLVLTSAGAAENLAALASAETRERLARCQLVASSDRVVKRAAELGLGAAAVRASDARDASLLEALAAWRQNAHTDREDWE